MVNLKFKNLIINIETTIIKIKLNDNKWLFIIRAYAAGNSRNDFSKDLSKIFDELKLEQSNHLYFLTGDLSARHELWGDHVNTTRGKYLKWWLAKNDFKYRIKLIGPNEPTFPAQTLSLTLGFLT